MRFAWLAEVVNRDPLGRFRHEIYRPWRRYDALVFLKAMGEGARRLVERARLGGVATLFDANVVYYSREGREYYEGMLPTATQQRDAETMTSCVDAVIADSMYIESWCRRFHDRVEWVPDSVRTDLVPSYRPYAGTGRLRLLWSGQVPKLVELLAIESVLKQFAGHLELVLVTNDLSEIERILPPHRERLRTLIDSLDITFLSYRDPRHLFEVYGEGGVLISPRFLDSEYNRGHTEWKVTLAMACGRCALCSPVPSYLVVAERAAGGVRVCAGEEAWSTTIEEMLNGGFPFADEEAAAREVVQRYYATDVVAAAHTRFLAGVLDG